MIKLDLKPFDVRDTNLSECGKYFTICTYTNRIMIYDIFRQLLYDCPLNISHLDIFNKNHEWVRNLYFYGIFKLFLESAFDKKNKN